MKVTYSRRSALDKGNLGQSQQVSPCTSHKSVRKVIKSCSHYSASWLVVCVMGKVSDGHIPPAHLLTELDHSRGEALAGL
jgi:hypothetical protein